MTAERISEIMGYSIAVDTREQKPLDFANHTKIPVVRKKLDVGDYSAVGFEKVIAIERKSPEDLIATLTHGRARFVRELERAKDAGVRSFVIFCEATYADIVAGAFRGSRCRRAICASIHAFQARYGVPTIFCSHPVYDIREASQIARLNRAALAEKANRAEMAGRVSEIIKYAVRESVGPKEWARRERLLAKEQDQERMNMLDDAPVF